jgi:p-cumate 2,3-dioxygenase beta subunit
MTTKVATASVAPARAEVEDLLFLEAQLLDEWRLEEWFALFADGATYEVPAAGACDDVTADNRLFYISDDYHRLRLRVGRLLDPMAHAESPRSIGSRMISNVRNLGAHERGWKFRSTFVTYRSKNDVTDTYFGHHFHVIVRVGDDLRIAAKRTMLDMTSLRPQGRVSIIL